MIFSPRGRMRTTARILLAQILGNDGHLIARFHVMKLLASANEVDLRGSSKVEHHHVIAAARTWLARSPRLRHL
jgi:hypothetical protein